MPTQGTAENVLFCLFSDLQFHFPLPLLPLAVGTEKDPSPNVSQFAPGTPGVYAGLHTALGAWLEPEERGCMAAGWGAAPVHSWGSKSGVNNHIATPRVSVAPSLLQLGNNLHQTCFLAPASFLGASSNV